MPGLGVTTFTKHVAEFGAGNPFGNRIELMQVKAS
jgi:hypothetical protein